MVMVGDRVEEAYNRLHPRLWHALLAYSGDPELASDAEAEAFTQALGRGDDLRDVDAWVWRSAFRIAAGLLKKRGEAGNLNLQAVHKHEQPDSIIEFISMLGELTDQQRAAVALRYVGNFRPAEIAELLGTTSGSIRVQLHRAHEQLRAALENSNE